MTWPAVGDAIASVEVMVEVDAMDVSSRRRVEVGIGRRRWRRKSRRRRSGGEVWGVLLCENGPGRAGLGLMRIWALQIYYYEARLACQSEILTENFLRDSHEKYTPKNIFVVQYETKYWGYTK
jgi:hypothetical protein